jgi:hypothetical protein
MLDCQLRWIEKRVRNLRRHINRVNNRTTAKHDTYELFQIFAIRAIASIAKQFGRKAFAVQFKTLGFFAVARMSLAPRSTAILFSYQSSNLSISGCLGRRRRKATFGADAILIG